MDYLKELQGLNESGKFEEFISRVGSAIRQLEMDALYDRDIIEIQEELIQAQAHVIQDLQKTIMCYKLRYPENQG